MKRPEMVDNFRIIDELGHGGMATVYRALDTQLEREVALKILHEHIAANPENRERFAREARAVARLNHPNIIRIYGYSSPDSQIGYIAAELIEGPTLRTFFREEFCRYPEIGVMLISIVARALQAAHEARILHRDLKPENIMIDAGGNARLMDFGLARMLDAQTMTMTGSLLGSPAHMAPEIIEGDDYDERVDIFALGTILYYLCSGKLPFDGQNPAVVLHRVAQGEFVALSQRNPLVVRALENIVHRAMAHRPDDRFSSALELAEALETYLVGLGIQDPQVEFARFYHDQAEWLERADGWLIDAMASHADDLALEGPARYPDALAWTDRVLQMAPEHEAALTLLHKLTRHDQRRKALRVGGLVALLIALIAGAFAVAAYEERRADLQAREEAMAEGTARIGEAASRAQRQSAIYISAESGGQQAAAVLSTARARALDIRLARVAPGLFAARRAIAEAIKSASDSAEELAARIDASSRARNGEAPSEQQEQAETDTPSVEVFDVAFLVQPPAALLYVDGEERCRGGTRCTLALSEGEHRVIARHPTTEMQVVDIIRVESDGATYRYRVPWRPATLVVESDRSGIVIFNGERIGTTNRPIEIPIEGLRSSVDGTLRVIPDGDFGTPVDRPISLSSGEVRRENVRF